MATLQETKSRLRKELKQKRSEISLEYYESSNIYIEGFVEALIKERKAETIHCFISMNERQEVNTHNLISSLLAHNKTVIVPIMNGEMLEHSKLESMDNLIQKSWGVIEPQKQIIADIQSIDIIFVPLLGIDNKGNRLGYGKGYYDRFLETSDALKIGLVFEDFILESIPSEKHDVKLDGFITEKGVRLL